MSFDWLFNDGGIIVVAIAAVPAWFLLRHFMLEMRARRAKLERDIHDGR
jgi:hypothetical protein